MESKLKINKKKITQIQENSEDDESSQKGKKSLKNNHLKNIDWSYILKYSDQSNYEIPNFFDKNQWKIGETYRMRIGNMYDPSKFWIVIKERELTMFQNFLYNFYHVNGEFYKMPIGNVKRNRYCVAFTDGGYYRGLIVNIPISATLRTKAIVFLFDFGFVAAVNADDLYYFNEKMFDLPQFATRACLYGVEPCDSDTWTSVVVNRFNDLTDKKVLLCILEVTDSSRKIVHIRISDVDDFLQIRDIGDLLMSEKLLKKAKIKVETEQRTSKMVPTTKYPFLFPSFEAIEGGLMPSSVSVSELLKHCITSIILFKPYYTYNGISLSD